MSIPITEIANGFKERNCVFLLGPNLVKNKKGEPPQSGLINYFKEKQLEIEEDMDNLFSCDDETKMRAYTYLKEYYRENREPSDLHRQLALIPCHLYISINPDLLMKQALEDHGVEHEFKYYVKDMQPDDVAKPTAEKPLLYNLFGSIDNKGSLIFTHGDLIQYLFSIIKEFRLPQNLREAVNDSDYFIFLGFDFEKWYLKLLLRLIYAEKKKNSIATGSGGSTNDKLRTFYKGNYGLKFVDTNIEEYVQSLYVECGKQGTLREIKTKTQPSIQEEIRELIKQDKVEEAIDRLVQVLEKKEEQFFKDKAEDRQNVLHDFDNFSGRLSRITRQLKRGEISREDHSVENNRIIAGVQAKMVELSL